MLDKILQKLEVPKGYTLRKCSRKGPKNIKASGNPIKNWKPKDPEIIRLSVFNQSTKRKWNHQKMLGKILETSKGL